MAQTIVTGSNSIDITIADTSDWNSETLYPMGLPVKSVQFVPGESGDELILREDSITGPRVCRLEASGTGSKIKYFAQGIGGQSNRIKLHMDYSECTFSANAYFIVEI